MINKTVLVGRMVADVDLRYTGNGKAVGNVRIAVNRPFKNASGENEADFINIVVWGKQAENLANYMKKGSQIGIDGRIQTRSFENNEGKTIFVTEVVADQVAFLDNKSASQNNNSQSNTNTPNNQQNNSQGTQNSNNETISNNGEPIDIQDDDLPF